MKRLKTILCATTLTFCASYAQQTIDLQGSWEFAIGDSTQYNDYVMLPGSMLTNGKGNDVTVDTRWTGSTYDSSYYFNPYMAKYREADNLKFPFFLTPEKHYVGRAWYKRSIYVPRDWRRQHITLFLERPHIETTVFVNGRQVGRQESLSTPHQYDVTPFIVPGERNTIAIGVYNGIEHVGVGQDSHSVTDQTQGNWNGIVGRMELRAQSQGRYIRQVRLHPYPFNGIVQVELTVDGDDGIYGEVAEVIVQREGNDSAAIVGRYFDLTRNHSILNMPVGNEVALWDEFHPNLYRIAITVGGDYYETTFGMREMTTEGRQLMINRRPLFLRGTVENCCFPETGYPPTDVQSWLDILGKCKAYGLNHVRFHSYCPPEAAFEAADKLGMYLQPEGPSWPNHGVKLRAGQVIDDYLLEESKRIVDAYGNHPSFVMMAAGNEPAGNWVAYCRDWVKEMRDYDASRLYCGASVGGGWAWDDGSEYHVKGGARGLDWDNHAPSSDDDYYQQILFPRNYPDSVPNETPVIAHEQGQWCAFPDFKEIPQYTGVYKAKNFEIFRDLLRDNGMASQAEKFLMASGKLQTLCYKYEIERNLRTKDYAGFQLLGLSDYSGQGTALEGVLNVHWREKGYTSAKEWTEFCSPIVPLARFPKFVYTTADTLVVPLEAYSAFYGDIKELRNTFYVCDDSLKVMAGGQVSVRGLPLGKNTDLGTVCIPLEGFAAPGKYTLYVNIAGQIRNHWDFWVYPEEVKSEEVKSEELLVTDSLDSKAVAILKKGGKVLLTAAGKVRLGNDVVQHYLPVFWNTSWFKMRPPHTTGAYIDNTHPLFRYGFPTDDWSNLNWWELLNKAQVMNLMEFPADYQPPIQPIDTWHVSRKLGMLVEANVLKGKLLMTTIDITSDLDHRVVARQMRQAILDYMESGDFQPALTLEPQVITDLFTKEAPKVNMFTKDSPDELKPKLNN
ncbi:MAG: beta-glucuronidase [Prevotella sp.]|nr:beta-glucuronidase [Prevotella sp.]